MPMKARLAALGVVVAILLATNDVPEGSLSLAVIAAAAAVAWRYVPEFWRTVLYGAASGAIAGLVILGPGFRIAMRIVAIIDPFKTPEFTVGGTLFIVVGIGGLFGGVLGIVGCLTRQAVGLGSTFVSGAILSAIVMGSLLADSDLREEFIELGSGPWVNIPMFGLVALAYAIAAMRMASRREERRLDGFEDLVGHFSTGEGVSGVTRN